MIRHTPRSAELVDADSPTTWPPRREEIDTAAPPIPVALHVGTRKKRIAITAETPPAKSLQKVAPAVADLSTFVDSLTAVGDSGCS